MKQLNLIEWTSSATVIAFPATARVGEARHVADVFCRQPSEKAQAAYWRRQIATFRRRLATAGVDAGTIDREIVAFRELVEIEISRLVPADRDCQPDGAA
ncbi:DUF6074 family protein [Oricola indica]|jgi:hypothetical protein|uniref:DUF6074 family protein n=1 Tax=Oricola indica TaxID=2872591 RepID=UPI003CCC336B